MFFSKFYVHFDSIMNSKIITFKLNISLINSIQETHF